MRSDSKLYEILRIIRENPGITPKELPAKVATGRAAVTHHLARLRDLGLVEARRTLRNGQTRKYYATSLHEGLTQAHLSAPAEEAKA